MPRVSRKRPNAVKSNANLRRKAVYYLAAILVLGITFVWLLGYVPSGQPSNDQRQKADVPSQTLVGKNDRFLLPEIAPSRFRNASSAVGYVGSHECIECHRDEHKT